MEELRETFKQRQEFEFENRKDLFYEAFQLHNQSPDSHLVSRNVWFLQDIPYMNKGEDTNVLIQLYEQSLMSSDDQLTVENFVEDLLESIKQLHFQICEREINCNSIRKSIKVLEEYYDIFVNKPNTLEINEQDNSLFISIVKDRSLNSDLHKFYNIKYKAATIHQNFCDINTEDVPKLCNLALGSNMNSLFIDVLGKPVKSDNMNNEFIVISNIELPLLEIYTSLKPKYLKLDVIPPTQLIINYKEFNDENKDENFIQLKFEIKLDKNERLKIIKKLLDYYKNLIFDLENGIKKRLAIIDEILFPFKKNIVYEKNKGLSHKKEDKRGCDINCILI